MQQQPEDCTMAFVDFIPPSHEQSASASPFTRFPGFHPPPHAPELVPRPLAPSGAPPAGPAPLNPTAPAQLFTSFSPATSFCPHCQFSSSYSLTGLCLNCNMPLPTSPSLLRGLPLQHSAAGISQHPGPVRPPRPQTHAPYKEVAGVHSVPSLHQSSLMGGRGFVDHHDTVDRFMMSSMMNVVNDVLQDTKESSEQGVGVVADLATSSSGWNRVGQTLSKAMTFPSGGFDMVARTSSASHSIPSMMTSSSYAPPLPGGERTVPASLDVTSVKVSLPSYCGMDPIAFSIDCQGFMGSNQPVITTSTTPTTAIHKSLPLLPSTPLLQDHHSPSESLPSSRRTTPPNPMEPLPSFEEGELDFHSDEKLAFFCPSCETLVCKSCANTEHAHCTCLGLQDAYLRYRPNLKESLGKTPVELDMLEYSLAEAKKMRENVREKQKEAISEVKKIFQAQREEVAKREQEILSQVNDIANMRVDSLISDEEKITKVLENIRALSKSGETSLQGHPGKELVASYKLNKQLQNSRQFTISSSPSEDDSFILKSNSASMAASLKSLCVFSTAPYPPFCTAMGEGLFHPRVNKLCTVILVAKDRSGEPCVEGGERLFIHLRSTGGGTPVPVPVDSRDNGNGSYSINFRPQVKGSHQLVISIRGQHVQGSPFTLFVDGGREYGRFGVLTQVFGSEGSQSGQFSRPWGICCDQQGNIIVGDRSNHRVQVFDTNGTFKHKFGTEGVRPGQFNRPAGVAVTREGHIVVADKDNHRIQVLKLDGTFLFVFGSKGGNDGQMIYPYDVAVNQLDGRIAVTDTGNHRLLIFSHDGILLGKFGYKGYLCGHFDSPRGIAFNEEGQIIVSDFNVHHILVIHPDGTTARILGSQGSGNGQFMRPQGIAVDHMGNFIVADTRNNRIVIMHSSGHMVAKFGETGSAPGQFDRPTSIAVLPDGRIAVVDFGNSRIQIF